jgi:endonuclease YncB( thermonuclease family)
LAVLAFLAGTALALGVAPAVAGEVVDGLAKVQADGSLRINGRTVRLFGVFIPIDDRTCRSSIRPPRCASKAVLVLDGMVSGFVRCEVVRAVGGGVVEGVCSVRGDDAFGPRDDLAAQLLQEGFALVRPDAPPAYFALERLAQAQERGLWSSGILNIR